MQHNNSLNCLFGLSWYPRNSQTNKNTSKEIISFDLWSTINFHIAYDVTVNFAIIIHTQCWNHSIILQSSIFSRKQRLNLSILDRLFQNWNGGSNRWLQVKFWLCRLNYFRVCGDLYLVLVPVKNPQLVLVVGKEAALQIKQVQQRLSFTINLALKILKTRELPGISLVNISNR